MALGRAICVLLPAEQPVPAGIYAGPVCRPLCAVVVLAHHSPWQRLGQVRMGAHVVQQSIGAALYASLFLSRLPPLCVYLMGISVRCTGVQSHCGLKRISDDRKYVNLLFPSGQREKVQRFNG